MVFTSRKLKYMKQLMVVDGNSLPKVEGKYKRQRIYNNTDRVTDEKVKSKDEDE